MSWIKYFVISAFFVVVIAFLIVLGIRHQSNITSTQDVGLGLSTLNVGEARESMEASMNKDALESNLLLRIAESQKGHEHDTKISYVFLDDQGNVTSDMDDVQSVQYKVELLNKNGKVISVSRERLEVHSLLGGDD